METPARFASTVRLSMPRAVVWFVIAYVAVTILGAALSFAIGAVIHNPDTTDLTLNRAYIMAERFYPLINLVVWTVCARFYFRPRSRGGTETARVIPDRRLALRLATFWICLALPVDFVGFVVIKNPLSLTPDQFYVGQFPWIYLIYLAVFAGPLCAVAVRRGGNPTGWQR